MRRRNCIVGVDEELSKRLRRQVFIQRSSKGTRRYTSVGDVDGKPSLMTLGKFLWNHYHPDDIVKKGESVHHKDFDCLNDDISNLVKLPDKEHNKLHMEYLEQCLITDYPCRKIG